MNVGLRLAKLGFIVCLNGTSSGSRHSLFAQFARRIGKPDMLDRIEYDTSSGYTWFHGRGREVYQSDTLMRQVAALLVDKPPSMLVVEIEDGEIKVVDDHSLESVCSRIVVLIDKRLTTVFNAA